MKRAGFRTRFEESMTFGLDVRGPPSCLPLNNRRVPCPIRPSDRRAGVHGMRLDIVTDGDRSPSVIRGRKDDYNRPSKAGDTPGAPARSPARGGTCPSVARAPETWGTGGYQHRSDEFDSATDGMSGWTAGRCRRDRAGTALGVRTSVWLAPHRRAGVVHPEHRPM